MGTESGRQEATAESGVHLAHFQEMQKLALMDTINTASLDALHDEIWVSGRSILLVKAYGVIVDQD